MRKERILGIVIGFVIVQSPILLYGWMNNDWVDGAHVSLELTSWASVAGSIVALTKMKKRPHVCTANRYSAIADRGASVGSGDTSGTVEQAD
ncbi:MAG: hypothetical protein Phyf2KO_11140 [Phycisphaerales bacterium]